MIHYYLVDVSFLHRLARETFSARRKSFPYVSESCWTAASHSFDLESSRQAKLKGTGFIVSPQQIVTVKMIDAH